MNKLIRKICSATALLAIVAGTGAQAAIAECGVTHRQCYPACVQMTPDGSDCAKTRQVCRAVCGSKSSYPSVSNTEQIEPSHQQASTPGPATAPEPPAPGENPLP